MKSRPNLLTLGMLVVAIGLERFAYYGTRSILMLHLVEREGLDHASASQLFRILSMLALFTPLLGGLLALGVGARITAVAGAAIAIAGYGLLTVGAPGTLCMILIAVGAGIFRPCPWAIAAEELGDEASPSGAAPGDAPKSARRFAAMSAMACVLYASINVAATVASIVMDWLRNASGPTAVFGVATLGMVLCAGMTCVVAYVGRSSAATSASNAADPYRAPGAPAPRVVRPSTGLAFAGLALLLVIELPYSVASSLSFLPAELMQGSSEITSAQMDLFMSLNPIVVVIASGFAFALLLVATLQRWSTPPLVLYGGGVLVFAVGLVPLALAGYSIALLLLGTALTAVGEAIVAPVTLAYAALASSGRARALVVAVWILVANFGAQIASLMNAERALRPLLIVIAVFLLVAGGLALAFARTVHRTLFDAPS